MDHFKKYLVRCLEVGGDVGLDKAVKVVKWWRILLRRYWREWEYIEANEENDGEIGKKVFWRVKQKMDLFVRKDLYR
jgi:DNA repair protein REV1